jgi:hypothetical protein
MRTRHTGRPRDDISAEEGGELATGQASTIAAHLMLANWRIERGQSAGAPSTSPDWSRHKP